MSAVFAGGGLLRRFFARLQARFKERGPVGDVELGRLDAHGDPRVGKGHGAADPDRRTAKGIVAEDEVRLGALVERDAQAPVARLQEA